MTDPTENEEINEELSTDELKSVSGGVFDGGDGEDELKVYGGGYTDSGRFKDPKGPGSGSGMTRVDFERANKNTEGSFTITEVGQP